MTIASDQAAAVDVTSAATEARLIAFRPQMQLHILAMTRDRAEAEELTLNCVAPEPRERVA